MSSNTFQAMLAAKKASAIALAAQGAAASKADVAAAINQATGPQSSAATISNMPTPPKPVKGLLDEEKAKASLAVYENNDFRPLKSVITTTGAQLRPDLGFFYATTDDHVAVLEQYVNKKLVTKVYPKVEQA